MRTFFRAQEGKTESAIMETHTGTESHQTATNDAPDKTPHK
ncbi:MAG: hypothetical protein AAB871_01910 [Patescibacteria group bacterium]